MNWRVSFLDRYRLTSNSDAHSPGKLGREATRFSCEPDFFAMRRALETGEGYAGTVEFFPEEGKYHLDGHRACGVRLLTHRLAHLVLERGVPAAACLAVTFIADRIGVDQSTVHRARKSTNAKSTSRTGRDGRTRRIPAKSRCRTLKKVKSPEVNDFIRELAEFTVEYSTRIRKWYNKNPPFAAPVI